MRIESPNLLVQARMQAVWAQMLIDESERHERRLSWRRRQNILNRIGALWGDSPRAFCDLADLRRQASRPARNRRGAFMPSSSRSAETQPVLTRPLAVVAGVTTIL